MRVPGAAASAAQALCVLVRAPFPDVARAVVESVRAAVRRKRSDGQGVAEAAAVRGVGRNPVVAPGEAPAVVATGRALPFRFRRKAHSQRPGKGVRLVPAHADHRLVWREVVAPSIVVPEARSGDSVLLAPAPAGLAPERGIPVRTAVDERGELGVGDRRLSDRVCRRGHAPPRMFVVLPFGRIGPHPELTRRHVAHPHPSHGNTKGARPEPDASRVSSGAAATTTIHPGR